MSGDREPRADPSDPVDDDEEETVSLDPERRPTERVFGTTLLGLGIPARMIAPRPAVARPAAAWNRWLSTVAGPAAPRGDTAPPPRADAPARLPAPAAPRVFDAADAIAWQKLWLATQRRPWRSLAVIPAGAVAFTPPVATALAEVGSCHLGPSMMVTDATTITLSRLEATMGELRARRENVRRVIVALGSVLENPASLALARAADAAVLCLVLGQSSIAEAEQTIEEVGRERFLGSVLLRG